MAHNESASSGGETSAVDSSSEANSQESASSVPSIGASSSASSKSAPSGKSSSSTVSSRPPSSSSMASSSTPAVNLSVEKIQYVTSMQEGSNVPFSVGVHQRVDSVRSSWDNHISIIRSYAELKELYRQDVKANSSNNYIQKYNEAFFRENVLIVLFFQRSSSMKDHKVDAVTKKDGQLCIGISTRQQGLQSWTTDMADFRTLIEVKRSDLKGVTRAVVYEDVWAY